MLMKPKQFYLAPLMMILIALSFPLQVMLLYGHAWTETQAIFAKMTSLNWAIAFSFILGAYYLFPKLHTNCWFFFCHNRTDSLYSCSIW